MEDETSRGGGVEGVVRDRVTRVTPSEERPSSIYDGLQRGVRSFFDPTRVKSVWRKLSPRMLSRGRWNPVS